MPARQSAAGAADPVAAIAEEEIARLRAEGLYREPRPAAAGPPGPRVLLAGPGGAPGPTREAIVFCGNDYLGLAADLRVRRAAAEAAERFGAGAGASRLMAGETTLHRELEAQLAAWKGAEAATAFPTGYQANVGAVTALAGRGDLVLSDERNHASLVDACRLSRAEVRVYPHADPEAAAAILAAEGAGFRRRLVLTEAVFSMLGDVSPIPELLSVAEAHGAVLVVDEAHATGVIGATGRGAAERFGLPPDAIPVSVVTFGKALGGQGGAVVGSAALSDLVRNRARTYIYTTALAPPMAAAVGAALRVLESEPGRVAALAARAGEARAALRGHGVPVARGETPILPVVVGDGGDPRRAVAVSRRLEEEGLLVAAVRPPTVPDGESGLRISIAVGHTSEEIGRLARALGEALEETDREEP
ncbi:MAG: 8-amino-7-oxononanoate synthase [Planctomycetales bacterium]|nr:8-amino-7-oxononanoate synthase [Planctomycetales bacterium]